MHEMFSSFFSSGVKTLWKGNSSSSSDASIKKGERCDDEMDEDGFVLVPDKDRHKRTRPSSNSDTDNKVIPL